MTMQQPADRRYGDQCSGSRDQLHDLAARQVADADDDCLKDVPGTTGKRGTRQGSLLLRHCA